MSRTTLPNRRPSILIRFEHEGHRYFGSASWFDDERPAEVFLDASRPGSQMQAIARDAAVVVSIALQHGAILDELVSAITRLDDGSPAGPMGKMLDIVSEISRRRRGFDPSNVADH